MIKFEARTSYRSITILDYEPDAEVVGDMANINGPNGLTYVCHVDDIFLRSEGMLGRVSIPQSVDLLTAQLEGMDTEELARFVDQVSQDRGIHSGRLELSIKYGHPTSHELAWDVLAHNFDMGEEALIGLSGENIYKNIPKPQAEGLLERLKSNGRLNVVKFGLYEGLQQNSTHLLSSGNILMIK